MELTFLNRRGWLGALALTAVTLAPLSAGATQALAAAPVRVVGCNPASLSADLIAAGVTIVGENSDGADDQTEEDQQPKIVGSIPKPRGVSEDDSKKLAELNIATVSREQALGMLGAAVANPPQHLVKKVVLEGENGYLVWAIKTELKDPKSGPDPRLEAKVDAGGEGRILSIECDPEDE